MEDIIRFELDYPAGEMSVERDAKIFEAGDYPDKGVTISEEDLDSIVESFTEAPVKVEHTDSPLDPLGTVKRIWRKGRELFARLAFPADLSAFLERRGVKSLSIALHRNPLRLAEVSLVLNPRVPTAAMFCGEDRSGSVASQDERDRRIEELEFALRERDVEARLFQLKLQGKIVPASEPYAREILLRGEDKIAFGDAVLTTAEMFEGFLSAQPAVIAFGELCPAGKGSSNPPLDSEEAEILAKLGVTPEQAERYR